MFSRPRTWLLITLAASAVLGSFQNQIDPYFADVLTRIGINITLAVSLNLINGHTGQFSLGHAGFMAIGAYTAAALTMFIGPHLLPADPSAIILLLWFLVAL
ncbi:MAG TPA: branched-chain amino acid ABC transporter permease, partial [Verrucomicrobiae bacterium]|nr:branched-chain amino acid ABC transporter permease [Verrucomicrobiae bacterium]